jgi:hypothetical protein
MLHYAGRRVFAGMRKDVALPAVVAAVLLCSLPAVARAGTYDVLACNAPGGGGVNKSWSVEQYDSGAVKQPPSASAFSAPKALDSCATAVGMTIGTVAAKQTVKANGGDAWTFHAPVGDTVKSFTPWRFGQARASQDDPGTTANESDSWEMIARAGDAAGGDATLGDVCVGNPATYPTFCPVGASGFQAASAIAFTNVNRAVVSWGFECTGVTANYCFTGDGTGNHAGAQFQGADVLVEDLVAPDAGTNAGAGWRRAVDPVTATATDSSGIRSIKVMVDGTQRAAQTFTCDFHLAAPCAVPGATAFDFAGIPDGPHTVDTVAEDAAGNVAKSSQSVLVDGTPPVVDLRPSSSGRTVHATVSDAASGVRSGLIEVRTSRKKPFVALKTTVRSGRMRATVPRGHSAGSIGIRLSATDNAGNAISQVATSMSLGVRVGKHTRKVRDGKATVPYGHSATVSGRLTTIDGDALVGQPIAVTSQLRRTGAVPEPIAGAVTDGRGRFSIPVAAGPSRNLVVTFAGNGTLLHRVRGASLRVPASSTIHAADLLVSGAAAVRFSGHLRLLGATLPPGGKLVDLQASQHGHWTTVATTRATASGWHAVARFRGTPGSYPVRLRIRREAVFPYDLGYSPSVVVRVR